MYKINRIALILCLLESFIFAAQAPLTPANTVLLFDLDDVIIQKAWYHKLGLFFGGIYQAPLNTHAYLDSLNAVRKSYKKDEDGVKEALCDKQGNPINGLTFHFLYHGSQHHELSPYVPWIVSTMENSRCYVDGTHKICRYLKHNKGYTIAFATNKDRISYDLTEQAFGQDFANLATHKFVAHPGIHKDTKKELKHFAQQEHVPASYKEFLDKALTVQPTETIHHVPTPKPDSNYYRCIRNTLGTDKHYVFTDDKQSNVTQFQALDMGTGIRFENHKQLANDLVKIGILSEKEDKAFLEDIRYPGMLGKIKLCCHKIIAIFTFRKKQYHDVLVA